MPHMIKADDKAVENKASMMSIRSTGLLKIKAPNYTQITGVSHHVCDVFTLQVDWRLKYYRTVGCSKLETTEGLLPGLWLNL